MNTLTLVTIVRNDKVGFQQTFSSVKSRPEWVKWVVIDGKSTDGTADYINSIATNVDFYISESDSGIADAFDKGILNSNTDFILFLNAGDSLVDGFFSATHSLLHTLDQNNKSIAVGRVNFGGRTIGLPVSIGMQKRRNYLPHQGMLIRRSLFKQFGLYDTDYRLGMDYEWSLRILDNWQEYMYFSEKILVYMDANGISVTNYPKTFLSYHLARMKQKTSLPTISYFYYIFFVFRRKISLNIKRYIKTISKDS